jgi:hypothetical protein
MAKNRGLNIKLKILALVVMLGIVGRVDAVSYFTSSKLLSDCEGEVVSVRNGCVSYLAGLVDTTSTLVVWGFIVEEFCIPNEVTTGQLRKIYIKFTNERPEALHQTASSMALMAFIDAFPCE